VLTFSIQESAILDEAVRQPVAPCTAPDPLIALGHAVGVIRIVIDFPARTKGQTAGLSQKIAG
jgi:hypothetical protein